MQLRHLAFPAYLVVFLLIVSPLIDTGVSVFPPRTGDLAWRFGAAGMFSRALMTPLLGLLLALVLATVLEQRRVQRAISIFTGLIALVGLGTIALFVLDGMQLRAQVRLEARTAFDVASAVALGKYVFVLLVLVAFTVSGWKASRGKKSASHTHVREEGGAPGLLIGQR